MKTWITNKTKKELELHLCSSIHVEKTTSNLYFSPLLADKTDIVFGETHGLSNQETRIYFPDMSYI